MFIFTRQELVGRVLMISRSCLNPARRRHGRLCRAWEWRRLSLGKSFEDDGVLDLARRSRTAIKAISSAPCGVAGRTRSISPASKPCAARSKSRGEPSTMLTSISGCRA